MGSRNRRHGAVRVALAVTFTLGGAIPVPARQPAPQCEQVPGFHRLDFWLGQWDVKIGDQLVGTNRIEKVLNGCAVIESWRGADGAEGRSLFFYDHVTDTWKQVWVTANATAPGGLKEKTLIETLPDGSLRFQGVVRLQDGRMYLDRTTLTPLPADRVRQHIEISVDDGSTWQSRFDAIYVRPTGLPADFAPRHIAPDLLLGVRRDAWGVARVVGYHLDRNARQEHRHACGRHHQQLRRIDSGRRDDGVDPTATRPRAFAAGGRSPESFDRTTQPARGGRRGCAWMAG